MNDDRSPKEAARKGSRPENAYSSIRWNGFDPLQIAVEDGGELLVLSGIFLISVVWSNQSNELADGSRG